MIEVVDNKRLGDARMQAKVLSSSARVVGELDSLNDKLAAKREHKVGMLLRTSNWKISSKPYIRRPWCVNSCNSCDRKRIFKQRSETLNGVLSRMIT